MPALQRLMYIALLIITLCSGCSSLLVTEPNVAILGASLTGLDSSGIDLEFRLRVFNPNSFDLSLLGYSYDLRIMDLPLATAEIREATVFTAATDTDMRLPVHLRFSDVMEIIRRQPDPDKVPYQMAALLHLNTPLGEKMIPVAKSSTLSIPQEYRPEVFINRLRGVLKSIR